MGGVDAVCAAGKTEGQVNLIATPNNWANYGQMITDFQTKYGIKVQSDQPDVDSQAEITAAQQLTGTGRQPDLFDLGSVVAAAHTDMYAPYQVATWADIPDGNKEPTGLWVNNYTGFESIAYDTKLGDITKVADLADPKYKGKVALNGDPLKASAGFNGVVMAALANGGSADNIAARRRLLQEPRRQRQPRPGGSERRPSVASGQTPIVVDWTYNQRRPRSRRSSRRASTGRSSSRRTPRRSPRTTTRRSTRTPHILRPPAAGWSTSSRTPARTPGSRGSRSRCASPRCRRQGPSSKAAMAAVNAADDRAGPADPGADRHRDQVPHRQLEVHHASSSHPA